MVIPSADRGGRASPEPASARVTHAPSLPAGLDAHRPLPDVRGSRVLTVVLAATVIWSLAEVEWRDGVFRANGLRVLGDALSGLARPDLSADVLATVARAAWLTTVYAVAGMTLALALALPLGVLASGVLWRGPTRGAVVAAGRGLLAALRSVHELVWAWLFVAALGLSPFAAVFALALPYSGILGRIYADLLNDVPEPPLSALRASGAAAGQVLLYGRLPMALPDMVAYTFYRFECALRSSAIMGFVGVGGLGFQIQIALSDLRYSTVSTLLLALVVLIAGVEAWSGAVRRELSR